MPVAHVEPIAFVLLTLSIVLAAARLGGSVAERFAQPAVLGELLVGVVLGNLPGVAGIWSAQVRSDPMIGLLAGVGAVVLLFEVGLESTLREMLRVGMRSLVVAVLGVIAPWLLGFLVGRLLLPDHSVYVHVFLGATLTATSVGITARVLRDLGHAQSLEARIILGAAVIDDVMGIIVLSIVVALATVAHGGQAGWPALGILGARIALFFALAIAGTRLLGPVLGWASRLGVSQALLSASVVIMCVYAWLAEYVGAIAAITGAYLAGVVLAQTPFKRDIDAGIHPLTYTLFVPAFFIGIGLQANARQLGGHAAFAIVLIAVAIVAKALGCGLFARLSGFSSAESLRVGIGMISRGEVGLIVAGYGLTNGLIDRDVFSASVVMVLATTMVTPPLLRLVFPRRRPEHVVYEETIAHAPQPEPAIE